LLKLDSFFICFLEIQVIKKITALWQRYCRGESSELPCVDATFDFVLNQVAIGGEMELVHKKALDNSMHYMQKNLVLDEEFCGALLQHGVLGESMVDSVKVGLLFVPI
jgi:hypothetical protein